MNSAIQSQKRIETNPQLRKPLLHQQLRNQSSQRNIISKLFFEERKGKLEEGCFPEREKDKLFDGLHSISSSEYKHFTDLITKERTCE